MTHSFPTRRSSDLLDPAAARAVWQRIAETLAGFPLGVYFSDVYFNERVQHPAVIAFGALLSAFVKGRMHVHFKSPQELTQIMKTAGFKRVRAIKTDAIRATHEYSKQRGGASVRVLEAWVRSEEHTSELQSLMRISYAVFCLKKKKEQR